MIPSRRLTKIGNNLKCQNTFRANLSEEVGRISSEIDFDISGHFVLFLFLVRFF